MLLQDLIGRNGSLPRVDITGVSADSRQVMPGVLFAALPGTVLDGRKFIAEAVAKGARAVMGAADAQSYVPQGVPFVAADNPRRELARLAARFYGRQPETIVAVTGTNGKTSVTNFIRQIWERMGVRSAAMGTLGLVHEDTQDYLWHTTPDTVVIHKTLASLKDKRVEYVAMEASSHGLDQYRLDGVRLKAAAFTNLTRDHLDYHPTIEHYRAAKLRLFTEVLPAGSLAVINRDGAGASHFEAASRGAGQRVFTVGEGGDDIKLVKRVPHLARQDLVIQYGGKSFEVQLPLPASFQASNALVAAGVVIGLGGDAAQVFAALAQLRGARGRLELAGETREGAPVFVDYAHTPDALENVLTALRAHTPSKLAVVFGAGGDRDPGKRPIMGAIAAKLADRVIVTDDNPRSEDPAKIRAAIMAQAKGASEIGDRHEAIRRAITELKSGDVLVIAGKGHETGQIVGNEVRPFDDLEEAKRVLAELGGRI